MTGAGPHANLRRPWRRAAARGARRRGPAALAVVALVALVVLVVPGGPARAHAPHDDIFAVAVSPAVADDGVVHTLSRGFLMRSTDAGETWTRVVQGLSNRVPLVALAAAPDDPDVLYAGTGDGLIYRSDDGGEDWAQVGALFQGLVPTALFVSPGGDALAAPVYATSDQGLLRSTDGGATWLPVHDPPTPVAGVAFDPTGEEVWAAGHDGTLHTSDDGGATWASEQIDGASHLTSILSLPGDDQVVLVGTGDGGVVRIEEDGSSELHDDGLPDEPVLGLATTGTGDDLIVYASTATTGAHRSVDGGRSWTVSDEGLTVDGQRDQPEYADRPDFGPIAAADLGRDGTAVFIGGFDGLFRSVDDAATWSEVVTIPATTVVGLALSPAFADDGTLMATTYLNGAHISRDGGRTWEPSNDGVAEPGQYDNGPDSFARLYGPAFSPDYPSDGTLYITRIRGLLRSTDRGATWTAIEVPGTGPDDGALNYLIAVPRPDRLLLAEVRTGRILRSEDGGRSLDVVGEVDGAITSLAVDPADPELVFVGTGAGVVTSTDGGVTWSPPATDQPWAATTLAVGDGPDAKVVVAGTPRGLQVSGDGGRTWRPADLGGSTDLPIEGVVASPAFADDGTLLVSARGAGLFRSTDRGDTFVAIAPELGPEQHIPTSYSKPTSAPIAFSPTFAEDRTVVASVGSDVLVSTDGGETWTAVTLDPATHPPVPASDEASSGWGRRRTAAVAAAGGLLVAGVVGVVVLTRRRRRDDR